MTGLFLQVRLGSSRLPEKALLPLSGKAVVEHVMEALKHVPADVYVLATEPNSAERLAPFADSCGFELFVGSETDVLSRYAGALRKYGADTVIRATGDNPLVSAELARWILDLHLETHADYSGFLQIPVGAGVEVLDGKALETADREAVDSYEREHVSPFLYRRPERFRINRPVVEARYRCPDLRITLDSPEDYRRLEGIFHRFYTGAPISLSSVLNWMRGDLEPASI